MVYIFKIKIQISENNNKTIVRKEKINKNMIQKLNRTGDIAFGMVNGTNHMGKLAITFNIKPNIFEIYTLLPGNVTYHTGIYLSLKKIPTKKI